MREPGSAPLAAALAAAVAKLGRFGASYPLYLEAPDGHEVHPAVELFEASSLGRFCERAIVDWTDHPEEEDKRAAASRFMRRYCGSMASAALVPLAHGVAFDVSIERVSPIIVAGMPMGVVLDLAGQRPFGSPQRPTTLPVETRPLPTAAALRAAALTSLVRDNLAPAFERVLAYVQLNPKLLWATAAEQIDMLFENAVDGHDDRELATLAEDRAAILFGPALPGVDGPNPRLWHTFRDRTTASDSRPTRVDRPRCYRVSASLIPGGQSVRPRGERS